VARDDGGGGTTTPQDYDSLPESAVNVDLTDLVSYYLKMSELGAQAIGPTLTELGEMSLLAHEGLTSPPPDGINPLPEAVHASRLLAHRKSDFMHFVQDLSEGITNVGAAAAVIAEIYESGDSENAATVNDIGFAFSDPRANRPSGFRGGEDIKSMDDVRREQAEAAGQTSLAAMGNDSLASQVIHPANGVTIYLFPDGSMKTITTTQTTSQSQYQSGSTITTTTVTGPGGVVVSRVQEESYSVYGGSRVNKVTTTSGDETNGTSATTTTTENPDGSMVVNSETSTTTNGETTTRQSDPVTVDPRDTSREETSPEGTVEHVQDRLGTDGSDDGKQEHGLGY
jgi:hypothetical protein